MNVSRFEIANVAVRISEGLPELVRVASIDRCSPLLTGVPKLMGGARTDRGCQN